LREPIVQQKFRFQWHILWHGGVEQLDNDMDTSAYSNGLQIDFQSQMILNESDQKCFSLSYARRTIRLQLTLLNDGDRHSSVIETLQSLMCLLLLSNENVYLIDYNQFGNILDKHLNVPELISQDEKLLQTIFETLEIVSATCLTLSIVNTDFYKRIKQVLLNPFISILKLNKVFCEKHKHFADII